MKNISFVAGLCAALLGMGGAVRGDVVYTTSTTSGAASNTNNIINGGTSLNDSMGLRLGTFGVSTFTKSADSAVVRFTVGGSNVVLQGIGINLFVDHVGGPDAPAGLTSATLTWRLYSGTSLTQVGTDVTQAISNVTHTGDGTGVNSYQGTSFSSSFNLTSGATYTLVLQGLSGLTVSGSPNNDDLHWTYKAGTGTVTNQWVVGAAGFTVGNYTGDAQAINSTGGIAFDLVAVPEPGTMAFGAIASVAGIGGWWTRRKKKVAEVKEEVEA